MIGAGAGAESAADALLEGVALDTPNCGRCLVPMEALESAAGAPFWGCRRCGASRLA